MRERDIPVDVYHYGCFWIKVRRRRRLSAPGTNAKSDITVSGVSFDPATGARVGGDEQTVAASCGTQPPLP
ncbi:hypothetical protein GGR56DRAFT_678885 [Xylariaceae sp. FL0804]|nr:hypothetical protein GGR56DRAFT_678885 [Xylariaceae sp. FL0804]